ncbi:MAG: hypothetical protein KatS3mg050_1506 [Litorilinea sp.]|nr:MAG: hypothetical protein KatS3mg050_1506 [Litorilinea sp.]
MTKILQGLPAAPGIGIGQLTIYRPDPFSPERIPLSSPQDPAQEWQNFLDAHGRVDAELKALGQESGAPFAEIFSAHRVILQDRTLLEAIEEAILEQGHTAITATYRVISEFAEQFQAFEDEYFASRSADILDLGRRLLAHLGAPASQIRLPELPPHTILVADDLTPSEIAQLAPTQIQGIALANSAPTAHSAILARSLGIPMVCILGPSLMEQQDGRPAIVDGNRGQLLVEPEEGLYQRYHRLRQDLLIQEVEAMAHAGEPAITLDGVPVPVYANANSPEDVRKSQEVGADGVGLLRTEYLFRSRATPPTVEEQQETYACFLEQVRRLLTVRALDAGGDKPVEFVPLGPENNPFLGLRGIRLLLARPELLRDQWLALQQAAASLGSGQAARASDKEIRFMLPMVSTVDEVKAARSILEPLAGEFPRIKLGIMIEVPSAALMADALAPLVDFFSIGTNDLSQYVLASDRTNSRVAQLADPLHPAVLHLIHRTCQAANGAGKPVSVCGEIAGDPTAVPLLLGLGVSELSVPLPAVPLVKQVIRRWTLSRCRELAETALRCASALEVRNLLAQES